MPNTDSKCKHRWTTDYPYGFKSNMKDVKYCKCGMYKINPHPSPTKEVESWEVRLEQEFYPYVINGKGYQLKDFIRKTLSESRKEVLRDLIRNRKTNLTVTAEGEHVSTKTYIGERWISIRELEEKLNKLK